MSSPTCPIRRYRRWVLMASPIEVRVYMVTVSYEQKPFRRSMMHSWGAEVSASPTELEDYDYPAEAIDEALHHLPKVRSCK